MCLKKQFKFPAKLLIWQWPEGDCFKTIVWRHMMYQGSQHLVAWKSKVYIMYSHCDQSIESIKHLIHGNSTDLLNTTWICMWLIQVIDNICLVFPQLPDILSPAPTAHLPIQTTLDWRLSLNVSSAFQARIAGRSKHMYWLTQLEKMKYFPGLLSKISSKIWIILRNSKIVVRKRSNYPSEWRRSFPSKSKIRLPNLSMHVG